MGPDTYDLVSLLRDSYVDLTEAQVDELIAYFLALRGQGLATGGGDAPRFRERFDLMALQRNLKALGTFGFQAATRGEPGVHPVHAAHAHLRAHQPRAPRAVRPAARAARRRAARAALTRHADRGSPPR